MGKKRRQKVQPKRKKGVKLGRDKVDQMWKMFQAGISCLSIGNALSISRPTVLKYKRAEKWIERRDAITQRANTKADNAQVSLLAENMRNVKLAKDKLIAQITKVKDGKQLTRTPISDLDKLIRLEEFLHGRPDSRPQLDYSKMTEEELTIELQTTITELSLIPECQQELKKLLASPTD